jgi:hypothetical protein
MVDYLTPKILDFEDCSHREFASILVKVSSDDASLINQPTRHCLQIPRLRTL